mmetsp:Transcript_3569/g.4506  ORF Transcript_3569/g.4506 Transcript_3569/m.4506 type:complete len:227 (-) Transcript_3569:9-689(-)
MHVCYAYEKWSNPAKKTLQEYLFPWQHAERWRAQYAAAGDFPLPSIADIDRNCDDAEFNLPIAHPQPRGRPRTKRKRVRSELFKQKLKALRSERSDRATATSPAADDDEGKDSNDDSPPSSPLASPIVGATSRMSSNGPPASNAREHESRKAAQYFSALPNSSCRMSPPSSSSRGHISRPPPPRDQPVCLIRNCLGADSRCSQQVPHFATSAHECGTCEVLAAAAN